MINEELNKEENVKIEDIDWESVSHGEKMSFSTIQFLADMYGNSVTVSKEIYSAKLETMFISVVIVLVGLLLKMSMVGIICTVGVYMFLSTILAPLQTIVSNAGKSHEVVINNLRSGIIHSDIQFRGYDASSDKEVDMFAHGIIDPVKVSRTALKNAVSVAITFLSIGAVIVEDTKDSEKDDQ